MLLHREGWRVNHKRVGLIWREEGLKVPHKQPKRSRLWLTDGSCVRHRPTHRNHVWAYDFVAVRTKDGRPLKLLTIVDLYTRECLAIDVDRRLRSDDVLHRLSELFVQHGVPEHIRSDNGPEFAAKAVREWLRRVGVQTLFIEPGSPRENGYVESFNGKLRDELLNGGIFETRWEATVLIERWRAPTTRFVRTARWAINHRLLRPGNLGTCNAPRLTRGIGTTIVGRSILRFIHDTNNTGDPSPR